MIAVCPHCRSRKFKVLPPRAFKDELAEMLGVWRLRCADCSQQYRRVWSPKDWFFAKCPRCYRSDLSFWSEEYYNPPSSVAFLIAMGAKRIRCEACRHNFASFRTVKERYRRPAERVAADTPENPVTSGEQMRA